MAHEERSDAEARPWFSRHFGAVRLRQLADEAEHRLSFVPTLYVLAAILLVQILLWVDGRLVTESLPSWLETTVASARSVFAAIAGGLITSTTLLLSIMLVAVQLASSQFSPRTLRDWLGNRRVQHAVGIVLGTTVFCLLALRSTRDFGENREPIIPHLTVLVAVTLGVLSLVAVVQAVDHITNSLRVESVATRLTDETTAVINRDRWTPEDIAWQVAPDSGAVAAGGDIIVPDHASPIVAPQSGWVQQVDARRLLDALPRGSTAYLTADVGTFVVRHSPVMWVAPSAPTSSSCHHDVFEAIAIGDTRTMQQDAQFGIIQLTDIAVRALSPGINDPTTACEIVVHLGVVLTALWEQPTERTTTRVGSHPDTVTLVRYQRPHSDHLTRALQPILDYGSGDARVVATLTQTVERLRSEAERRDLAGPVGPLTDFLEEIGSVVENR